MTSFLFKVTHIRSNGSVDVVGNGKLPSDDVSVVIDVLNGSEVPEGVRVTFAYNPLSLRTLDLTIRIAGKDVAYTPAPAAPVVKPAPAKRNRARSRKSSK